MAGRIVCKGNQITTHHMNIAINNKKVELLALVNGNVEVLETRTSKTGFSQEDVDALNATETRGKWCI